MKLHGMLRFGRSALVLVGFVASSAVTATALAGQAPASAPGDQPKVQLRGVVIDAGTYVPVESATISLVGSSTTVTTPASGVFELDVPAGAVTFHVSAPGHSTVVVDVEVHDDRPIFVRVPLPTIALTLSELLVEAQGAEPRSPPARTAAELVAQELPSANMNAGQVGQNDFGLNLRLATSFTASTAPTVVVDGVVLSRGSEAFEVLDRIPAADVYDVQVLRGPSAAFLYPFAANGVILVTTRRGQGR